MIESTRSKAMTTQRDEKQFRELLEECERYLKSKEAAVQTEEIFSNEAGCQT